MGVFPFAPNPQMALQAQTPQAGFALQNATPTIVSWTAPADGKNHRVVVVASQTANAGATGGAIGITMTAPDGTVGTPQIFGATPGAGFHNMSFPVYNIQSGSTFSIVQTSALTAGASTLWAELWGS